MPLYGYARVSTRDQDLASQDAELMAAGCAKMFKEKASGREDGPARAGQGHRQARGRRRAGGDAPRPAGALDQGLAQRARRDRQARRWLQKPQRYLGRHHPRLTAG